MSSNPVFAYKANATVDGDKVGTARKKREEFRRAAISAYVVMVIMQFLDRAWPWSREQLEEMADFYPRMAESDCEVLLPLAQGSIDKKRRVVVRRIVVKTLYSPLRAFAAVLSTVSIN